MRPTALATFFLLAITCTAQIDLSHLDGRVTESEKRLFQLLGKNGNSQLSIAQEDGYLKINVTSDTMYVASLCLCINKKKTIVLHASAALGNVNYESGSKGQWNSSDTFDWQLRENDMSFETIELRKAHLETYGWVANTLGMGSQREAEFVISRSLLEGNNISLAAGLMPKADPENIIGIPAETSGDCAAFSLVAGPPEPAYQFDPERWLKIKL
ncbi:MAG: hypothetical protein ABJP45_07995 [Cyclobacteriaceae bacterium]